MAGRGRPVPALAAGLAGLGKQWSENNTVSAAGKGLGNIAGVFKLGIGDDVYVAAAGLVEVVAAGCSGVGNRGAHGRVDANGLGVGGHTRAYDDAGRAGAHQV